MKPTSFTVKTALLATLIISGRSFAQSLPDEINHPQYLKVYQNLEQVLTAKTAEYESLADQKAEIEANLSRLQQQQQQLPARNADLQRLIDAKRNELTKINEDISGIEAVLNDVIRDLRAFDLKIAQLQQDSGQEQQRNQQIQAQRNQIAQDVNRLNVRLQQELREEQQSTTVLNNLVRGMNNDIEKRNQDAQEHQTLTRSIERFKRELPALKTKVAANNQAIASKKTLLADAQGKLPGVKAKVAAEQSNVDQADAEINPKKARLAELRAELARLTPEIVKLQKENTDLAAKIESNKTKINATGLKTLIARRDALETELASVNAQIKTMSEKIVNLKEALKPDLAELNDVRTQIAALQRSGANPTELARLKLQADAIEKRIAPKRQEIVRTEKQYDVLVLSVQPKNQELASTKDKITAAEATVATLTAENESASAKIAANNQIIDERTAANSGLVKDINDLDAVVKALEVKRNRAATALAQAKSEETAVTSSITNLTRDIAALEADSVQVVKDVAQMEKAIADAPLDLRRLENRIKSFDEQIQTARVQISREEKLLARIQQDRVVIQRDTEAAQAALNLANQALNQSTNLINSLEARIQKETQDRATLTRYNQDSVNRRAALLNQKQLAEEAITNSSAEIATNNQSIATSARDLTNARNQLTTITPKVAAAQNAVSDAQNKVDVADDQYQNRVSLYQRYLSEAQSLGTERANIGTADGQRAGSQEAKSKATKVAVENASAEAKWVAMRTAYVRGEIGGYDTGYDAGIASSADASQGTTDGTNAGIKRAKDEANLVMKPQIFLDELSRRLMEDEVNKNKSNHMAVMMDEVKMLVSAKVVMSDIPDLTAAEIAASQRILSSLDALIEQSAIEARAVVSLRARLGDARGVYTTPGIGTNANTANCSGVYKNVKDFVEACKATYGASYQGLYASAHKASFIAEYGSTFSDQIVKTFDAEMNRLYPTFLKEATSVGKDVGLAAGKKEIYRQSFSRSEAQAYSSTITAEEARVEGEAIALVEEHLKNNAALTLKGQPTLSGDAVIGTAPGIEAQLKMVVKNIGSKASIGNSLVRIKEISSNVSTISREAAIATVAPKSLVEMNVMKVSVKETAVPGDLIVIAGEIVHPGNNYRASRVENFRLETVVAVNAAIDSTFAIEASPKANKKKRKLDVSVTPKFAGVPEGYVVSVEEVGSNYVKFTSASKTTERLARGAAKKVTLEYKVDKAGKGKLINLKVTVKNGSLVVKTHDLQIKPK